MTRIVRSAAAVMEKDIVVMFWLVLDLEDYDGWVEGIVTTVYSV
jgi:hypothetical protein